MYFVGYTHPQNSSLSVYSVYHRQMQKATAVLALGWSNLTRKVLPTSWIEARLLLVMKYGISRQKRTIIYILKQAQTKHSVLPCLIWDGADKINNCPAQPGYKCWCAVFVRNNVKPIFPPRALLFGAPFFVEIFPKNSTYFAVLTRKRQSDMLYCY